MAGYWDRVAARDRQSAKDRIAQVYRNRNLPLPANIEAQADRVVASGGNYLDQIRSHANRNQRNPGELQRFNQQYQAPQPSQPSQPGPVNEAVDNLNDTITGLQDQLRQQQRQDQLLRQEAQRRARNAARAAVPWMPDPLVDRYMDHWAETGNVQTALNELRQSNDYEEFFPGIKRDDGSLRLTERQWYAEMEGYKQTLENFNIPAQVFESKLPRLIENGVNSDEFHQRVSRRYSQVVAMGENTRRFYAQRFGTGDISDSALLASMLDPEMDPLVAEEQFRRARIGGAALDAGFDVGMAEVDRLAEFGFNREAAQRFFKKARSLVPTVRDLAARHNDPEDDFDIEHAMDALVFEDPEEVDRLERLFATERASFSDRSGTFAGQGGRLTGLTPR